MDTVEKVMGRTILLVKHGSHAYGTNVATSDLDVKGVAIEPTEYHLGYSKQFEQLERLVGKGHDQDMVVYSLKKFVKLAADCNPNIIEVLHVDESDILYSNKYGDRLRSMGQQMLSKRARHTFSGYAHAQLKRIKSHRAWLLNPPRRAPTREEFELQSDRKVSASEMSVLQTFVDETPDALSKSLYTLYIREKAYQNAKAQWEQYCTWKAKRNPARAALEARCGYDSKHGGHLLRLMRMCEEILRDGKVIVKRPDAEEIVAVRNGTWSYEKLIEEAEKLEKRCEALYLESDVLPHAPNVNWIQKQLVEITEAYLREHG